MPQARVNVSESFPVPPERLFEIISDHEGMGEWLDARVSIIATGPEGGVGTVRRVAARGLAIDEEVTYFDPPRRLVYRIVRGLPGLRFHRGEMLVEPWGETGSQLTWDVILDSAIPGLPQVMAAVLRPALHDGLARLRSKLAEAAA